MTEAPRSLSVSRGEIGSEVEVVVKRSSKRMRFVSLHHHSTFSYLDGYGHPKEHVGRAVELGMNALALTEHGNLSSHPKLEQAAREFGIKPIFGCELYTGGPEPMQKKNHLTVWAETQEGYRNLMRLLSWAWTKEEDGGGFYYEPTVTGPKLAEYRSGLLVGSGCLGSLLATSCIGGKNIDPEEASYKRGRDLAGRFRDLLGDAYYIEVQAFPTLEATCKLNPMLERIARELAIPLVATADVHYCLPTDNEMQVILHAVRPGSKRTAEEQARSWSYDVLLCHPQSDREVLKKLLGTGLSEDTVKAALANTQEIAQRCNVELPKAAPLRYSNEGEPREAFMAWLREGWTYRRMGAKENVSDYVERLKYEVSIIEGKDFVDYFLIVAEMTKWAKSHNLLVGPARGSAAASLVCYLLRITEVDPLLFADLVFERFISPDRADLPDIDLDFDDRRRPEVFAHLKEVYGEDRSGTLGTFTTYKSKNSLDDVARVFSVPKWEVDTIKEFLIERSSGDLRASATIEDTVEMFEAPRGVFERYPDLYKSMRLEGMVKGTGKHAAGAIVSTDPLNDTCATYGDVIAVDKYDAEYLNLIKIDVLGLSTCGMLAEAMAILGEDVDYIYGVPLDDPLTLQGFRDNDVVGVFQFDGRAMRIVNNALKPDNFYEVCVVNALARPGPLHNGAMNDYVDIKHGSKEPGETHPLFDDIVGNTYYQVVYQEQILRIVREIGGFDWTAAAYIRKIISRKLGDQEFNRQGAKFLRGAKKNGVPKSVAEMIWGTCITAGSYAFNAAHSVSYGMLAWWTMWLKIHHPQVFYVSSLRRMPDKKHLDLMRDANRHGLKVIPPSPKSSAATWEAKGARTILAGYTAIPKIGEKMAASIIEAGPFGDWSDLISVKGIGEKTLNNIKLWVGQEDPLGVHVLDRTMKKAIGLIRTGDLTGRDGRRLPYPTHRTADVPMGKGKDTEVVWIGVVNERHLRDLFEVNMARTGVPLEKDEVKDPQLREWVIMYGTDGDDILTLRVDRWRYPRFKNAIWSLRPGRDLILAKGLKRGWSPQRIVDISHMTVIEADASTTLVEAGVEDE